MVLNCPHPHCWRQAKWSHTLLWLQMFVKFVMLVWGTSSLAQAMPSGLQGCVQAPSYEPVEAPLRRITVNTVSELEHAVANLEEGTEIVLAPGQYRLRKTLYIRKDHVVIRGAMADCESTQLIGPGMEERNFGAAPHGIWTDAAHVQVAHLSLKDFFHHPIQYDPKAYAPVVYQCKLLNAGEQFIKASAKEYGKGADAGQVLFTMMGYLEKPPTSDHGGGGSGYTNGVDVHAGKNWLVSDNVFVNFHVPDGADNLWNPAVLFWNGAQHTIVQNNRFIDVDRAIAFGLVERDQGGETGQRFDHYGGQIINNMVSLSPGLFSMLRKVRSDASILVWDSPNTLVAHNTILNQGNHFHAIEGRFDVSGVRIVNNLSDSAYRIRGLGTKESSGYIFHNFSRAQSRFFIEPELANLRLGPYAAMADLSAPAVKEVKFDIDKQARPQKQVTQGADEPDAAR